MSAVPDFSTVVTEALMQARGQSAPEAVRARFAREPELDEAASKEAGRPVHRVREFIYMLLPGKPEWERFRASEMHRQRFAREWHWFLDTEKEPTEGDPISSWNAVTRLQAEELKWAGVKTVQDLAAWDLQARPVNAERAALVSLAQEWLSGQDAKDRRIAELEAQVAELEARPRRGRPPKVRDDDAIDDSAGGGPGAGDTFADSSSGSE